MIVYTPLWETMRRRGITTYTLREKYRISGSTVQRLKKNLSVSTNTLSDLCALLDCRLEDVARYEPDL
ncbi:MAG TPA: helix-turn-helix transcriptional regulator [Candidatus Avoscillospira stercorigallinarum]|uniref:Helix-turn-helix transcriptional regulator n=1 Tax=Candidatus Avoscillospira stercorigallinarum TaxID=2840708 RepID=A0A9D0Z6X9_9FIRM|nr:helix-turn-helix transcriptional regulator [Candidatus Avoscillospira stercorigallinarum]